LNWVRTYRLDASVALFTTIGVLDNAINFGYAYEFNTSSIGDYNNGTHELILKFRLYCYL